MRHRSRFRAAVAVLVALAATQLSATSFLVPSDRELVRQADAIVIATVNGSYTTNRGRGIETIFLLTIERVLKGSLKSKSALTIVEAGGVYGGAASIIPGTPQYVAGERNLIFLERNRRGDWRTWGMILGKFTFTRDDLGQELLVRAAAGEELFGWNSAGKLHEERARGAAIFVEFIGKRVRGLEADENYVVPVFRSATAIKSFNHQGFGARSYQTPVGGVGVRWKQFCDAAAVCVVNGNPAINNQPVTFRTRSEPQAGYSDSLGAVSRAMAAWNGDVNSNINLQQGSSGGPPYNPLSQNGDGVNVIEFNSSNSDFGGGAVGVSNQRCETGCDFFTAAGFDHFTITESDVAIRTTFPTGRPPALLDEVLTHELGHSLGFRHSAECPFPTCNPAPPPAPPPTTNDAVMNWISTASFGANLRQYDRDAASHVYPSSAAASLRGDANGDSALTSGDIFYLINHLFAGGPAPIGNGDANSDGGITSGDVFFLINHLFAGGPAPQPAMSPPVLSLSKDLQPLGRRNLSGSISVGSHHGVAGRKVVIPVRVQANGNAPDALAFRVVYSPASAVRRSTIRRAGITAARSPLFEAAPSTADSASYVAAFSPGTLSGDQPGGEVVAEIEIELRAGTRAETEVSLTIEPETAALGDLSGNSMATVASGSLRLSGGTVTVWARSRPAAAPDTRPHAHEAPE